jgi:hypothetical protein
MAVLPTSPVDLVDLTILLVFIAFIVSISDEIAYYEILFYKAHPEKCSRSSGERVFKTASGR